MRRATIAACLGLAIVLAAAAQPAHASYTDVPPDHWAADAVDVVAVQNDWLRFGGDEFNPNSRVTRRLLARALVRTFLPEGVVDPELVFPDLPTEDPWYQVVNIAVSQGWILADGDGSFRPLDTATKRVMDRALTFALGLREVARGLNQIATEDGIQIRVPSTFGPLVLADQLRLHYNHPTGSERFERSPGEAVSRADLAYALAESVEAIGSWRISSLEAYRTIVLPAMSAKQLTGVEWAFRWVGYPYVYAGEWHRPTPQGYCCGPQKHGGFDCSGFTWWVVAAPGSGWDNTRLRGYRGWSLPQRSSYDMAHATEVRIPLAELQPLDVAFFDTDGAGTGWRSVDHAGISLGGGWMIHSSGSRGGVTIDRIDQGWWEGAFKWGRRLLPSTPPEPG